MRGEEDPYLKIKEAGGRETCLWPSGLYTRGWDRAMDYLRRLLSRKNAACPRGESDHQTRRHQLLPSKELRGLLIKAV